MNKTITINNSPEHPTKSYTIHEINKAWDNVLKDDMKLHLNLKQTIAIFWEHLTNNDKHV